jgi:murein DD-endopeptidase MepM/ murein hydrolase activator NlpD
MVRLLRVDTPALWRIAAHGAVLALTAGVLVVSQVLSADLRAGVPADDDQFSEWARQASSFIPRAVPQTSSAGGNIGGIADAIPGFVSPGAIAEADQSLMPWDKPEAHVLKAGETLSSIAAEYGVEPLWLLWTNPEIQKNPHNIALGTELTVLPMKAVVHVVKEGDSVGGLAEQYKAKAEDIQSYPTNQLAGGAALAPGMRLVIPEGESSVAFPSLPSAKSTLPPRTVASWAAPDGGAPVVGSGNFHIAAYGRITTRYRRGHLGVDMANHTGTPIYAIDGGTATIAGWWSWAGKAVKIDHGNGYSSLYAHMSAINVSPGQAVQPGQVIGAIGCTRGRGGYCSGPHLHLEVYYQGRYVNPCSLNGVCY